jgi:hypothetical protein
VKLVVAPSVTLKETVDLTSLKGTVRPALPGVPVQIQKLSSTHRWTTIGKVMPTRIGRFVFTPSVLGGTYRARVIAGHGWAVGLSPKVAAQ